MKKTVLFILLLLSSGLTAKDSNHVLFQSAGYSFPYDLNAPSIHLELPKILNEISGLTYINEHTLAAVQDEKGIVFLIDTRNGEIKDEIKMHENGDYEGVEIVDDNIWMIKSNGTLYRIKNFDSKKKEVDEYKTDLRAKNNCEGLGYDPVSKQLLIACKGYPFLKKDKGGKSIKNIYAFDPDKKKLKKVVLSIHLDSLKQHIDHNTLAKWGLKFLSLFDSSMGDLTFQPSGIAVHPQTKDLYVLGSIGKIILVFDRSNELKTMVKLKKHLFPQAEGICFDENGNLYIANEGKDKKATLLKFTMKE